MIRGLGEWAKQNNVEIKNDPSPQPTQPKREYAMQLENEPPMMFRAQISGRCSLQFASEPEHLQQWKKELIRPARDAKPCYQYEKPETLQKSDRLYQIQVKFPYRLCSNSGQDSIIRPVLGKNGIPILPGSSVKGAFLRACRKWDAIHGTALELKYCGTTEKPGALRFHSAYPVGNWSERMVDVVHSQQDWQVGKRSSNTEPVTQPPPASPAQPLPAPQRQPQPTPQPQTGNHPVLNRPPVRPTPTLNPPPNRPISSQQSQQRRGNRNGNRQEPNNPGKSAVALISLYQPTMIFEFSRGNGKEQIDWQEVEQLLNLALDLGIGGKTSTGYGYAQASKPDYARNDAANRDRYNLALHIPLQGTGVISKLLGQESEFRPNMFKASLRGHLRRLLAGVCHDDRIVEREADRWFGCTDSEGIIQLFWETSQPANEDLQLYQVQGTLHLSALEAERERLHQLFQFAYIMGGFGKSWRRVAHSEFYPSYPQQRGKYHIGCHWSSSGTGNWLSVKSKEQLREFLNGLYQHCQNWARGLGANANQSLNWREAWHQNCVAVYAKAVTKSQAIQLFHEQPNHPFKSTPAICGKKQLTRNGRTKMEFMVSSVWHRMLPINENQYLEIVTVFHGGSSSQQQDWQRNGESQLLAFIQALERKGLTRIWGARPT